jgi:hypothetical protein
MEQKANKTLGLTLIIGSLALGLAWSGFLIYSPNAALELLEAASVKAVLVFIGDMLIMLLGLSIYKYFHLPNARRLSFYLARTFLFVGILAASVPPGLVAIEKVKYASGGNLLFEASFRDAGGMSIWIFLIAVIAVVYFAHQYFSLTKYEAQNGPLG